MQITSTWSNFLLIELWEGYGKSLLKIYILGFSSRSYFINHMSLNYTKKGKGELGFHLMVKFSALCIIL